MKDLFQCFTIHNSRASNKRYDERFHHGVTKLKPTRSPRVFDEHAALRAERSSKSIQTAKSAEVRSQELVKKSKEMMETILDRKQDCKKVS